MPVNIQDTGLSGKISTSSLGAAKGINLLTAPEFLTTEFCQSNDNYIIEQSGKLKKRGGTDLIFEVSGNNPITLLKEFTSDIWYFAYNTTLASYTISTDTVANIKTDFTTSDPFSGERYGDYFFICNGGDKIYSVTAGTATVLASSPKAKVISIINNTIFAGNIEGEPSKIQWSKKDDGTNPPFTVWAGASPAAAGDAGEAQNRNAGELKAFAPLGSQVVALYDSGKVGFRLETIEIDAVGLSQFTHTDFERIDFGSERGAIATPFGIFYVNESGLWQLVNGGNTSQPFSSVENNPSRIFGDDFIESIDFTKADIIYDNKRGNIMITCAKNGSFNNYVLWYNIENQLFGTFSGINISRFMKIGADIYYADAVSTQVYKLFVASDDAGVDIQTNFKQEIVVGDTDSIKELVETTIKGFFSQQGLINISFDIYDKYGILHTNFKSYTLNSAGLNANAKGFNEFGFGDGFGEGTNNTNLIETRASKRTRISKFTRIILNITSSDSYPHEFTYIKLDTRSKGENTTKNNLI